MLRALSIAVAAAALLALGSFALLQIESVQDEARCWVTVGFYSPHKQGPVPAGTPVVQAQAETEPVFNSCDAADDPAIWVNRENPEASLVVGTNKRRGLNVYNLSGELLSQVRIGQTNNVDVREYRLGSREVVVIGATDKGTSEIVLFELDPTNGRLHELPSRIQTRVEVETYGFCLYLSKRTGSLYAIATDKSGQIEQWLLKPLASGDGFDGEHVRSLRVESQPEGCVADDEYGQLFVGEEARGVWKFGAEPGDGEAGELIAKASEPITEDARLYADVEGLSIYAPEGETAGYLVASSQGNDTYVLFDRLRPHAYRGTFQIELNGHKTGDTDGLDVTAFAVGDRFPGGLLVVQDGAPAWTDRHDQNFKLVSWSEIQASIHTAPPPHTR